MEPFRSQLLLAGARKFERAPAASYPENTPPSAPSPDPTVRSIQQKLSQLGYAPGPADGLMGQNTRRAILAYQADHSLPQNGVADDFLDSHIVSSLAAQADVKKSQPRTVSTDKTRSIPPSSLSKARENAIIYGVAESEKCGPGYRSIGGQCRPIDIPENAIMDASGMGWACSPGFYRVGAGCEGVDVPANATLNSLGDGWQCQRGYRRVGGECHIVAIPPNAVLDYSGAGWSCNHGYFRSGEGCQPIRPPPNAHLNSIGTDWVCNEGYRRVRLRCVLAPFSGR